MFSQWIKFRIRVKVSYSRTENNVSIISSYDEKIINPKKEEWLPRKCRIQDQCWLGRNQDTELIHCQI